MRNIDELVGIIKGINFDGVVNEKETERLREWVDQNRNLACEHEHMELIRIVDEVLADGIITNEERTILLGYTDTFFSGLDESKTRIYELNGIIDGIICDGVVNQAEILKLKEWIDENNEKVRWHAPSREICEAVENILKDGIITEEEQQGLLKLIKQQISSAKFETKLEYLRNQIRMKRNIGIDLIDLLDNEGAIHKIHRKADFQIVHALSSVSGKYVSDPEIVMISLILIAMLEYDGSYYESVRKIYSTAYKYFPEQKVEGLIRDILNRYRSSEDIGTRSRIINVALSNALVPRHYLSAFFEFIFDIYKLNFECELPEDPYEDFRFVYEGLRSTMLSAGDDIQVHVTQKTYKLIRTTKNLITDRKQLDSLIKLSIIVSKLIDKKYWEKKLEIYNPYLKTGFEGWASGLHEERAERKKYSSGQHSLWEPKIILHQNRVCLLPPVHKVKAEYDYRDISIIVENNGKRIYENKTPDIREIIGGYRVSISAIELKEPLGTVSYKIMAGNHEIYNSKEKLYRRMIVFDADGNEIKNNTDYEGTAIFCYKNETDELVPFAKTEQYILASRKVLYSDVCFLEDVSFHFSSLLKPGLFGKKYENYSIVQAETENEMPVFQEIDYLVFESEASVKEHRIKINETEHPLTAFHYTPSMREGVCKYVVDLDIRKAGIYSVAVYQCSAQHRNLAFRFRAACDPDLKTEQSKLDDRTYSISVQSGLSEAAIVKDIFADQFSENTVYFFYENEKYYYHIPFEFELFRISDNSWVPFADTLWIGEVGQDTKLDVYDAKIDKMIVYSNQGTVLSDGISAKQNGVYCQFPIGFLNSYKTEYDFVILYFVQNEKVKHAVYCYNKCVLNKNSIDISFDTVTKELAVAAEYFGRGNVYFELLDRDGENVFQSTKIESGAVQKIPNVRSFVPYMIRFYEKPKGLMLQKKRILEEIKRTFYALDDFPGRTFKIREVYFNQIVRGKFEEKMFYLKRPYISILKKEEDNTYRGEIYVNTLRGKYYLNHINPVEIEFCSEVIDGTMDIYMTKDGDGLLLDFDHSSIMNTLDDPNATDIFSYTIDIDGGTKIEKKKSN